VNWKRLGRKQLWPYLRKYHGHYLKRLRKIKKSLRTFSEIRTWAFRIQSRSANHSVVMSNRKQINERMCFICDRINGAVGWKITKHRWYVSTSMEKRNIVLETRQASYVYRKIEARSLKHCCSAKAVNLKFHVCSTVHCTVHVQYKATKCPFSKLIF
jgi:hypothetical protein